jgi:uncharacterized membrane protein
MQKISVWAKHHQITARFYIACIRLLLAVLAYYVAVTLTQIKIFIPAAPVYAAALLLLVTGVLLYPVIANKKEFKYQFYVRQKFCDFIIPLSAAIVFITWVNNAGNTNASYASGKASIVIKPTAEQILKSGKTKETLTRQEKRILKKEFFHQLKIYAGAVLTGDKEKSAQAWKIILAIVGLVGLLFLLAALACSLSCNGSDAAAVIVGVLGLAGLIWGFIAILKAIKRGPKKKTENKAE